MIKQSCYVHRHQILSTCVQELSSKIYIFLSLCTWTAKFECRIHGPPLQSNCYCLIIQCRVNYFGGAYRAMQRYAISMTTSPHKGFVDLMMHANYIDTIPRQKIRTRQQFPIKINKTSFSDLRSASELDKAQRKCSCYTKWNVKKFWDITVDYQKLSHPAHVVLPYTLENIRGFQTIDWMAELQMVEQVALNFHLIELRM